ATAVARRDLRALPRRRARRRPRPAGAARAPGSGVPTLSRRRARGGEPARDQRHAAPGTRSRARARRGTSALAGALPRAARRRHRAAGVIGTPGVRPVLARFAGCALPIPPDPVARAWRLSAPGSLQRTPGVRPVLARFAGCALPIPPDPVAR